MCGEQQRSLRVLICGIGSPPRVRGTVASKSVSKRLLRITPACAGNSTPLRCRDFHIEDHPRVCGEQAVMATTLITQLGSPPRVRGTANNGDLDNPVSGITPACAGNSLCSFRLMPKT